MKKQISGDELAVGGQAVLEGVMMRSKEKYTVSVLNPEGKIERLEGKLPQKQGLYKKITETYFIRGIFALGSALKLGYKALNFSADIAIKEEGEESSGKFESIIMVMSLMISIAFAIFLFKFMPYWLSGFALAEKSAGFVWLEGFIKASIFLGYLSLISTSKQIRRVFEFHGAEHKAVHCYEEHGTGKKLNPKEAQKFPRIHKRCGTTFLFLVILVSIFVYAIIPIKLGFWASFAIRLLFLPLIAGIAFEILQLYPKLSNKNPIKWLIGLIEYPGLLMQKITTREPDKEQLKVAIDALRKVVNKKRKL